MDFKKRIIRLKIRRFDLSGLGRILLTEKSENPEVIKKSIEIAPYTDANVIKTELQRICSVSDDKVMKVRNEKGAHIPICFLADPSFPDENFFIDITNISYVDKNSASLLQDAYVDSVRQKIRTLESRIAQSELLLPQLEWRRQAYMEETVNGLSGKVAFLNRRFDELLPQCRMKQPETMA